MSEEIIPRHIDFIDRTMQGSKRIVNRPRRTRSRAVHPCVFNRIMQQLTLVHVGICNHVDMQSAESICQVIWKLILNCTDIRIVARFDPTCTCLAVRALPSMLSSF